MKKQFSLFVAFMVAFSISAHAQGKCEVLKEALSGTYTGGCKNGLAHGKGTAIGIDEYTGQFSKGLPHGKGVYKWSTGEEYSGQWRNGKRHGIGTYAFFSNGEDTICEGQWVNDQYIGPVLPKPRVTQNINVERYTFKKTDTGFNRVLIFLNQGGMPNTTVTNLMMVSSSGYEIRMGNSNGFESVVFPVLINISYKTLNKLKTATYQVTFEFKISEPGDWKVELSN